MNFDQFLESPWFSLLAIIGVALVLWYYVKHTYKAAIDPTHRTSQTLFKNFVWGKPLVYVIIGGIPIIVLVALSYSVLKGV